MAILSIPLSTTNKQSLFLCHTGIEDVPDTDPRNDFSYRGVVLWYIHAWWVFLALFVRVVGTANNASEKNGKDN